VELRQRGAEIRVALVRDDDETSRLRNGEVDACNARVRLEKLLAQVRARRFGEARGVAQPGFGAQLRCVWKSSPTSSRFRWMDGKMMWLGGSPRI